MGVAGNKTGNELFEKGPLTGLGIGIGNGSKILSMKHTPQNSIEKKSTK